MTDHTNHDDDRVLVAIDIAKQSHDALILWPSGKKRAVKIANTRQGYEELLARTGTESNRVCAGFEPTADYHRNIAYWLQQ